MEHTANALHILIPVLELKPYDGAAGLGPFQSICTDNTYDMMERQPQQEVLSLSKTAKSSQKVVHIWNRGLRE